MIRARLRKRAGCSLRKNDYYSSRPWETWRHMTWGDEQSVCGTLADASVPIYSMAMRKRKPVASGGKEK
jgi:hypothetical protein